MGDPLNRLLTVLVLSLLAASTIPAADAAQAPDATDWSPATTGTAILSFAMSGDGSTMVSGLRATQDGGQLPGGTPSGSDLTILRWDGNATWNNSCSATCADRTHVAVSEDGRWVAVGDELGRLEVYERAGDNYTLAWTRIPDNAGIQAALQNPRPVRALAMDAQATRVVVATASNANDLNVTAYPNNADPERLWRWPGTTDGGHQGLLTEAVMSDDGRWVALAGERLVENSSTGILYTFNAATGTLGAAAQTNGAVTSLAMTGDGNFLLAGTASGNVTAYARQDGAGNLFPGNPLALGGTVTSVAFSGHANQPTAAAAHDDRVTFLQRSANFDLQVGWTANHTSAADVTLTPDGGLLLAAGAGGGAAWATPSGTPLYTVGGTPDFVTVGPDARRVAFAGGSTVSAYTHAPHLDVRQVDEDGNPLASPPVISTNPGETAVFRIALENNGTLADTGRIVLPTTNQVDVQANATTYTTQPAERDLITVRVTPGNVVPSTYTVTIRAVSDLTGESKEIDLHYAVGNVTGITLSYGGPTDFVLEPGDEEDINLQVVNGGNRGVNFTLEVTQNPSNGVGWSLDVAPQPGTFDLLGRGGIGPASVTIRVPTTTPDGTTNDVRIVAVTEDGTRSLPVDISLVVNPQYAANLTGPAAGRFLQAGQSAWFNLTLSNTGTVETTYQVVWDVSASERGIAWNSDLEGLNGEGRVTLAPGAEQGLILKLHAPRNAPVGSSATAALRVVDFNPAPVLPLLQEWLNLTAVISAGDDVLPQVDDGDALFIPAPGVAALLGSVALIAVTRRWRR